MRTSLMASPHLDINDMPLVVTDEHFETVESVEAIKMATEEDANVAIETMKESSVTAHPLCVGYAQSREERRKEHEEWHRHRGTRIKIALKPVQRLKTESVKW